MRATTIASLLAVLLLGTGGATRFTPAPTSAARAASAAAAAAPAASPAPAIVPNDNRKPAGTFANGVLTIALEARAGTWYPDGPKGKAIPVSAFAEVGRGLETPGPLIRVPVGTEVRATVRNSLTKPMWLYGMSAKAGMKDSVRIAAGAAKDMRFKQTQAGTYAYAARTDTFPVAARLGEDAQLGGAMIVDPAGATAPNDRVFVITNYFEIDPKSKSGIGPGMGLVFNGIGFPANERLQLTQGDSIHWRFVNLSSLEHPLHLHGFYYRVDARGDGNRDTIYTVAERRMAVTELVKPLGTMAMTFSPERSGNWVFHCHIASHITPYDALESDRTVMKHADHGGGSSAAPEPNHMIGLVMQMNVRRKGAAPAALPAARPIRMIIRSRANVYGKNVGYAFVLGGSPEEKDRNAMKVPGPQLEMTRGERVAITIVNQSHESAAIHWHGIELESFPDGVPGISGEGGTILPHIQAGDSLTVRFTPPRAGTFMYHSHSNEFQQISSGLYGALIVREPGQMPSVEAERVLLISEGGPFINFFDPAQIPPTLVNGERAPAPMDVKAGTPARFRLINIRSDIAMDVSLLDGGKLAQWRIVAKDGFPASTRQSAPRPAAVTISVGETYDLEVVPRAGAKLVWRYGVNGLPTTVLKPTEVGMRIR
jgi:FtsP/CotA-like multicopper oxidase with cupredoxin domain